MASFLFVGCLPGTTTPVTEEEEEEEEEVVITTVAPVITDITDAANVVLFSLTSTATLYMNKAEVVNGIIVHGTAPTYSEVRVYIDDLCAGTGNTGDTGIFEVVIAKADLGADAEKTLYATAKEAAIAVSAKSVEYTFTLDTDLPGIDSVAATADGAFVNTTATPLIGVLTGFTSPLVVTVALSGTGAVYLTPGVYTVVVSSATQVTVTTPAGVAGAPLLFAAAAVADAAIPELTLTFIAAPVLGEACTITVVGGTAAITDRYTLKFDENVDFTGAAAGVYDIFINGVAVAAAGDPDTYKESNDTCYWDTEGALGLGSTVTFTVYGVTDLAGNPGGTVAVPLTSNCFAGLASATSLAP